MLERENLESSGEKDRKTRERGRGGGEGGEKAGAEEGVLFFSRGGKIELIPSSALPVLDT